MPRIDISDELYARLAAFEPIVEAVIEEQINVDTVAELALGQGLDVMLSSVIGSNDPALLHASLHRLAERHPEIVHGFVAEMFKTGAAEREGARQRIGFAPSPEGQGSDRSG
jgi:hypothetical protein